MYPQPLLQWIALLWHTLRIHSGDVSFQASVILMNLCIPRKIKIWVYFELLAVGVSSSGCCRLWPSGGQWNDRWAWREPFISGSINVDFKNHQNQHQHQHQYQHRHSSPAESYFRCCRSWLPQSRRGTAALERHARHAQVCFFDSKKSYICAFVVSVYDVRLFILVRRPAVVCVLSLCVGLWLWWWTSFTRLICLGCVIVCLGSNMVACVCLWVWFCSFFVRLSVCGCVVCMRLSICLLLHCWL